MKPGELNQALQQLEAAALLRQRHLITSPCSTTVNVDGRQNLAFASNDYLGLAADPRLIHVAQQSAQQWGVGSGASHLVSGHYLPHERTERCLADWLGFEAALGFSTGYLANLAVIPALLGRKDAIFADRLNHASLVDSALLSRAEFNRYAHGDLAQLAQQLAASAAPTKLIVTDAVFSMDGDIAPLPQLLGLAETHDAWLFVDDAHGLGVLGPQGRGTLAQLGLQSPRLILMGTLGKAMGVAGAFVAGSKPLIQWLQQKARSYIFTTAAPALLAATVEASIDLVMNADDRRQHLQALISRLRERLQLTRWQLLDSQTPIQPVVIGDNQETLSVSHALWEKGFWVPAIRPPTVPRGSARLRISLSAAHQLKEVDCLADTLNALEQQG